MTTKEKIETINKEYGISYAKIGEMAGVNKSTLQKWMRGDRDTINPEYENALDVALANMADRLNEIVYGKAESQFEYDDNFFD